uniref:Uncharacterized protein n=1 Tax=Quercus lobata TaxID=97700 RepID=A0A7N2M5N2_QUELO
MSRPWVLVCLLLLIVFTSQFEWKQQYGNELEASSITSQKQNYISEREEAVKEKHVIVLQSIGFANLTKDLRTEFFRDKIFTGDNLRGRGLDFVDWCIMFVVMGRRWIICYSIVKKLISCGAWFLDLLGFLRSCQYQLQILFLSLANKVEEAAEPTTNRCDADRLANEWLVEETVVLAEDQKMWYAKSQWADKYITEDSEEQRPPFLDMNKDGNLRTMADHRDCWVRRAICGGRVKADACASRDDRRA